MATFSFDIVSDYDKAAMNNVFEQTGREIESRYDFKGTPAAIEWLNSAKSGFKLTGNSEWQLSAILDIVRKKLAARNLSQKLLDTTQAITTSNLKSSQEVPFIQGLDQTKAKQVTAVIREHFPKVKTNVQGDTVRVQSASKNDLQAVIRLIQSQDFSFPVEVTNFR